MTKKILVTQLGKRERAGLVQNGKQIYSELRKESFERWTPKGLASWTLKMRKIFETDNIIICSRCYDLHYLIKTPLMINSYKLSHGKNYMYGK